MPVSSQVPRIKFSLILRILLFRLLLFHTSSSWSTSSSKYIKVYMHFHINVLVPILIHILTCIILILINIFIWIYQVAHSLANSSKSDHHKNMADNQSWGWWYCEDHDMTTRLILGFHRASQLEQILLQNCSVKPSFLSANHWHNQTHHFHTVATFGSNRCLQIWANHPFSDNFLLQLLLPVAFLRSHDILFTSLPFPFFFCSSLSLPSFFLFFYFHSPHILQSS